MSLTADQLAIRRTGLGSSEIAAVAGVDGEPVGVWLDKMGLAERNETGGMACGSALEEPIARMRAAQIGAEILKGDTVRHHAIPWALATPDFYARPGPPVWEVKNVGLWARNEWDDGVPLKYEIQVTWQLGILELPCADVVALICGTDLRTYRIDFDAELFAGLLALGEEFWHRYVLPKVQPPCGGEWARKAAKARWKTSDGRMLAATPEAEHLHHELCAVRATMQEAEERAAALEAQAMGLIGEADGINDCFTWKAQAGKTKWADVAREMGAPATLIKEHTGAPARRFLVK